MRRSLHRLGMNLCQRKILIDKMSTGIVGQQLGYDRLCVLAMRTFKIRELYQLNGFRSPALGRAVRSRLQNLTIILERLGSEWKQSVGDQELAIRQGEKGELRCLIFRSGSGRLHQYQDSTHALRRGRQD